MALTVNFEQLKQQAQQSQQEEASQLKAIGIVQIGGKYYKTDPTVDTQGIEDKALAEAAAKSKADKMYPSMANTPAPSAAQTTEMSGQSSTLDIAKQIRNIVSDPTKNNLIDTGRSQVAKQIFRSWFGPGDQSSEEQQLIASMNLLKANFMKSISGAAVSEAEAKRLAKSLPDITDTRQEILSKLDSIENNVGLSQKNLNAQFQPSTPTKTLTNTGRPDISSFEGGN